MAYELLKEEVKKTGKKIAICIFAIPYSVYQGFYKSYPHGFPEWPEVEQAFNKLFLNRQRQNLPSSLEEIE
jgi:hypothetical protein